MSRHVEVETVGTEFTPHAVALAGFRAGWRVAFSIMRDIMRDAGAPPSVLRTLLEAQTRPPEPVVQVQAEVGHA